MTTPPADPLGKKMALVRVAEMNVAVEQGSVTTLLVSARTDYVIHETVEARQLDALKLLLSNGAGDIDRQRYGRRPLHLAVQACFGMSASSGPDVGYQMVELLLQHGAQPNACSGDDDAEGTTLSIATKRGTARVVAMLLDYGADPNARNASGHTALHMAAQLPPFSFSIHVTEVIHVLLRRGACPLQQDILGATPLLYAWEPDLHRLFARAERWRSLSAIPALNRWTASKDARGGGTAGNVLCTAPWLLPEVFHTVVAFL